MMDPTVSADRFQHSGDVEARERYYYLRDNPAGCASCHELPGDKERDEERERNAT